MAATNLMCSIQNTIYPVKDGSFDFKDQIDQRSACTFIVEDIAGTSHFSYGQPVTVTDTLSGLWFSGFIHTSQEQRLPGTSVIEHTIDTFDNHFLADSIANDKNYTNQYAGTIALDMIKNKLSFKGVNANYAIDQDITQADFSAGTLSGTVASANIGDGDLELALAGNVVTVTEATTSKFNAGSLTNMTASGNALGPSATSAMKITATQSVAGLSNSYTYVKFWSGSIAVITGRYLTYDLWIDSSSPEAKIAVDLIFTDGTSLRDNAISNNGQWFDDQNKGPHPNVDLKGLATDQWYHRSFLMDNFAGSKTIAYALIAIEGDSAGTYIGYVKNVVWLDSGGTNHGTFFSGSLSISPPQQMQKQGYGTTSVSVVNTYDCSTASRVSPSYSINAAKILKTSFLSYKTTLPTGYTFNLSYSIDGGNSYTPFTSDSSVVNNTALPNFPAGLNLSGKSIQFLQSFNQDAGADPSQKPLLNSMQLTIQPSYTASKSDVNAEFTTNGQWNAGGTSFSGTQAPSNVLMPFGAVKNWDDGDVSVQTLFGGGATGPNNSNSCFQYVDSKQFRMEVHQSTEARSRLDLAGTWTDFQMEFDVSVDNTAMKVGCVYATTGWSNYDGTYAYAIEIIGTTIKLFKGSNNGGASSNFAPTQVGSTATVNLTSQSMHRIKVIHSGTSHSIYFDDTLAINATDATYTTAGNVGFRISNTDASNGYIGTFDNWGISPISLGGTWTSQSVSLTSAGTYENSVVQWLDTSTDPTQVTNTVQSSIDGGSTYQTLTNGGAIPNLTAGQSLSGVSVKFKITFSANSSTVLPEMQYLTAYILGGFSSTGTRISPPLSLTPVGICGNTLVSWNAVTPPNTSVTVATSTDGVSYTNVSNGGSIFGINGQPTPTLDTFSVNSSAAYTLTFRTGGALGAWAWDTTNSRVTVSGGTNALLLYTSISVKDVDIILDIDQSDQCGIVWRQQDASNFYELDIFDASSGAGSTNVVKLFKVVANVKTQIGSSVAISFTRGDKHRFHVSMIGTAITVYMDSFTSIISTTDSSLAGPGKSGIIEVSGVGRFYNLRIQPIGDNLTGKQVFCEITLGSTDPISTPQLTDMVVEATNPNIGQGALIPSADYAQKIVSANMDDLAQQSGTYYWLIDKNLNAIFQDRITTPAPWILQSSDQQLLLDSLTCTMSADLYRNRQTLTGVIEEIAVLEEKIGDNNTTSWSLQLPVTAAPTITLNNQSVTVGVKGDTGFDFYYAINDNTIAQDSSGAVLDVTDVLVIDYTGQTTTFITLDNTGQFTGTISQQQFASMSSLNNMAFTLLSQSSTTHSTSSDTGDISVAFYKQIAVDINITANSGTSPTATFFVDRKGADGNYYNIWSSSAISSSSTQVSTTIGANSVIKHSLGGLVRLRWTIGGSSSPSVTFSYSIQGKLDFFAAGLGVVEATEDVSSQNLSIASATTYGNGLLQKYGAIGHTLDFKTLRSGLANGQYLSVFILEHNLNDAAMLITSVETTQFLSVDPDTGQNTQIYEYSVEAVDGPNLGSYIKLFQSLFQ